MTVERKVALLFAVNAIINVPGRLMLLIVLTNWLWIPFILWGDLAVRRRERGSMLQHS